MKVFNLSLIFVVFSSLYLLCPFVSKSQDISGNEPVAIAYFKAGNYAKALPIFTVLINKLPDNAMYNYYYGVCLIKNNRFDTAAKEALLNAVVDKTPQNCNFYLGNYFQAREDWGEAIDFYKRYKGSKQERKELELDKYLDLCMKRINPFKVIKSDEKKIFIDTSNVNFQEPDEKNFPIPDSLKSEWFNFQINDQLTYHSITDFKSPAAKVLFIKGWIATNKNDSIVKITDLLRKAHEETHNVTARLSLVQRIVDSEQLSYNLLNEREKYFEQVRAKESGYWEKSGADATLNFAREIADREKIKYNQILHETKKTEIVASKVSTEKVATDTTEIETKDDEEKPKASNQDIIVYKVQIGSFPNGKLTADFKTMYAKLSKFRKIEKCTDNWKNEIFTVGKFTDYNDACLLKNQLILEGAKGAFLASYKNGERIPLSQALKKQPGN